MGCTQCAECSQTSSLDSGKTVWEWKWAWASSCWFNWVLLKDQDLMLILSITGANRFGFDSFAIPYAGNDWNRLAILYAGGYLHHRSSMRPNWMRKGYAMTMGFGPLDFCLVAEIICPLWLRKVEGWTDLIWATCGMWLLDPIQFYYVDSLHLHFPSIGILIQVNAST